MKTQNFLSLRIKIACNLKDTQNLRWHSYLTIFSKNPCKIEPDRFLILIVQNFSQCVTHNIHHQIFDPKLITF